MVYPVYKGTLERFVPTRTTPVGLGDALNAWRGDLGASIEYLGTRTDIDASRLAYIGSGTRRIETLFFRRGAPRGASRACLFRQRFRRTSVEPVAR
jgi:hypothetical protein